MRRGTRWLVAVPAAGLFVAAAFGVAAATDGVGAGGEAGPEYQHGAMLGDVDQDRDRDRDRIHVDDTTAATLEADQDRVRGQDRLQLRDGSCQEEETTAASSEEAVPTQERTRTRAHEGDRGNGSCACQAHEEQNQNADTSGEPQQEQEQNVSEAPMEAGPPEEAGGSDSGGHGSF